MSTQNRIFYHSSYYALGFFYWLCNAWPFQFVVGWARNNFNNNTTTITTMLLWGVSRLFHNVQSNKQPNTKSNPNPNQTTTQQAAVNISASYLFTWCSIIAPVVLRSIVIVLFPTTTDYTVTKSRSSHTWLVSASWQVCKPGHPNVGFIGTTGYQVQRLEIVAENYRKNARILPGALQFLVPEDVCVPSDANLFDLTDVNWNRVHRTAVSIGQIFINIIIIAYCNKNISTT